MDATARDEVDHAVLHRDHAKLVEVLQLVVDSLLVRPHLGHIPEVKALQTVVSDYQPETVQLKHQLENEKSADEQEASYAEQRSVHERRELLRIYAVVHSDDLLLKDVLVESFAFEVEEGCHEEGPDHDDCEKDDSNHAADRLLYFHKTATDVKEENAIMRHL